MNNKLQIVPITLRAANDYVVSFHRHHKASQGHKFSIAVSDGNKVCGVMIAGRPVARNSDDGKTLEVNRVCTDGTPNACSMLYRAAWRAGNAMGYKRMITYTLSSENGASLRGAGFRLIGLRGGGTWDRVKRGRTDKHPIEQKLLWEIAQP